MTLKKFLKEISPLISENPVAVISVSPRKNGTCDTVAEKIRTSGKRISVFRLADYKILPCGGCVRCRTGKCVIKDDFAKIFKDISPAERFIFISPVYFSGVPAQFKAMIDRCELFWENKIKPVKGGRGWFVLIGEREKNYIACAEKPVKAFFRTVGIKYEKGVYFKKHEIR
ncbi:MAG: flavodoxin family protein [Elusimicrobia bacterium]|nr:flavodoxin family protein [Elusimicrobiota bacterium]